MKASWNMLWCAFRSAEICKARFFLIVDLQEFFFQILGRGTKKSSEND